MKFYNCRICKKKKELTTPTKDMEDEVKKNFGEEFDAEDCDIVCDDCYKKHFEFIETGVIIKT